MLIKVIFGVALLVLHTAHADIFKCITEKGIIYYNDKPCLVKDKQKKIKAQKDIKNGFTPKKTLLKVNKENNVKKNDAKEIKAVTRVNKNEVRAQNKKLLGKRPSEAEERILFINTHAGSRAGSNELIKK